MSASLRDKITVLLTAVFLFGFSVWAFCKPADAVSQSERRPLSSFPAVEQEAVFSGKWMQDFEEYTLDQFPLRDTFRGLKAFSVFSLFGQKDNNQVYLVGDHASRLDFPLDEESLEYAVSRFRRAYELCFQDTDARVFFSIIPDKNYFMAEANGYPSLDYSRLFSYMKENTDFMEYISIEDLLQLSDYYQTDAHWRQEEIVDVANRLGEAMGIPAFSEYQLRRLERPFFGVYHGQSALPLPGETLYYLDSPLLEQCRVYDYESDSYLPVYNMDKAQGQDPYEMFLSGSRSLLVLENPNAKTDRELVIFRDSFGSSLAPLLAHGYASVTLVDIRYLPVERVSQLLEFKNPDVLFLYSTSVLNNSVTLK